MSDVTIPEDIREAAAAIAYDMMIPSVAAPVIKALMAERERCAKIAEEHGTAVSNELIGKACSRNIATAIRRGTRA